MARQAYTWRPIGTGDVDAWLRLDAAVVAADNLEELQSHDELTELFAPSWARPEELSVAAFDDGGELAGLVWLRARPAAQRVFCLLTIHPDHRDGELPDALLAALLERADLLGREGGEATTVVVDAQPDQHLRVELLEAHGFEPARRFLEMRRDLSVPIAPGEAPDGTRVRPWERAWSEPSRHAHIEAFADHWGSSPPDPETWDLHYVGGSTFRPDLTFVVEHDGDVAGYVLCHAYPQDWDLLGFKDAWVQTLGTRPAWQGRGVASALLSAAMRAMRDAGLDYAAIGVDSQNRSGAHLLYERRGFEVARTHISYERPIA